MLYIGYLEVQSGFQDEEFLMSFRNGIILSGDEQWRERERQRERGGGSELCVVTIS
jgi:hypothetical protein